MSKSLSESLTSDEPDNVPDSKLLHNHVELGFDAHGPGRQFGRFWGMTMRVKHPVIPNRWYVFLPSHEWTAWDENERCFNEIPSFLSFNQERIQVVFDQLYEQGLRPTKW